MKRFLRSAMAGAVAAWSVTLHAQPLIEHVPEDAAVYVGWQGVDAMGEIYDRSNLKGILDATQLEAIFSQFLPALAEQVPLGEPEVAILRQAAPILWHRPWAVYVVDVPLGADPQATRAALGLVIDAGDQAPTVRGWFEQIIRSYSRPGEPPQLIEQGQVLGLVMGQAAGPRSLGNSQRFQSAMQHGLEAPGSILYVDTAAAMKWIDAILAEEDDKARAWWLRVRDGLGLDAIEQFLSTAGLDGKDWRSETFVHIPAPRPDIGLPALLAGEPIGDEDLKLIPRSATWMYITRFDTARILDILRDVIAIGGPDAAEQFNAGLAQASAMTGVDLEADLIRSLGDTWALYSDPAVAGPMGYGIVLVNPLKDAAAVEAALVRLETSANARMSAEHGGGAGPFSGAMRFKTMISGEIEIHSLTFPMLAPSWAVHEGRLYVAVFPQAIVSAHFHASQPGGASILDNGKFRAVRTGMGDHAATTLSFADLPQTAPAAYQSYLMVTQMLTAMMPGDNAPTMLLPPLGQIMPYISPAGSMSWIDDAGWHIVSTSPFPGSSMLSQQAMMNPFGGASVSAMGVGIMLPALGAARDSARAVQSLSNLKQISNALHVYVNDHDVWPASLSELTPRHMPGLEVFVHPRTDVFVPDVEGLSQERLANWIANNSSYIYVQPPDDWKATADPANDIMLFERPEFATDAGIGVGYLDGHVARRPLRDIAHQLREQTGRSMEELIVEAETEEGVVNVPAD